MLTPTLQWTRKTDKRWLKLSGYEVEGLVGSVAILDQVAISVGDGMEAGVNQLAADMQTYARQMAPWRDRTYAARTNLFGVAVIEPPNYAAMIQGDQNGAPHLFWLETRWGGRYAILGPTQEVFKSRAAGIIAGEVNLEMRGQGSKFRHTKSGRFI